jgi:hypothetical protein
MPMLKILDETNGSTSELQNKSSRTPVHRRGQPGRNTPASTEASCSCGTWRHRTRGRWRRQAAPRVPHEGDVLLPGGEAKRPGIVSHMVARGKVSACRVCRNRSARVQPRRLQCKWARPHADLRSTTPHGYRIPSFASLVEEQLALSDLRGGGSSGSDVEEGKRNRGLGLRLGALQWCPSSRRCRRS